MSSLTSWNRGSGDSLFDRIRGEAPLSPSRTDLHTLMISVKRQLARVLNTRPGNCRSAPTLGVIDLNDATQGSADIRGSIREAIRQCIIEFEPRIVQVDVRSADSGSSELDMTFRVTAHVRVDEQEQVASFDIHMDSHRHYRMI
ncbi:lysozyme [Pluralibacter gergoviae]|uniref:type VI secretion system baseplate subunit TssE n=1 Tax=Pluralibacter gergoviae TaxID=61647 RepID=UPI0004F7B167|nr:type VI secretion system baseplate subunit TssE [Pluralibacter gergoviae]AIQ99832.1 lysozyme [Pluralibacter gergoviae]